MKNPLVISIIACVIALIALVFALLPAEENPQGLQFYMQDDGTYIVSCGDAKHLSNIVIPETYKGGAVVGIDNKAFAYCSSLTNITIPESVTSVGNGAFLGCTSLSSVTIPNSVTSIGHFAFHCCTSLTSITIGDSLTSVGLYAFEGCCSLIEVCNKSQLNINADTTDIDFAVPYAKHIITEESQSAIKYVDDYVFFDDGNEVYLIKYLGNDTEITLPEYEGGKEYGIWEYAFIDPIYCCSDFSAFLEDVWLCIDYKLLTSVTIPDSVTSIGECAFLGCNSLTNINFEGTVKQWQAISKHYGWDTETEKYIIYCTDGTIAKNGKVTYK